MAAIFCLGLYRGHDIVDRFFPRTECDFQTWYGSTCNRYKTAISGPFLAALFCRRTCILEYFGSPMKIPKQCTQAEDTQDVNLITLHALRENGTEFQKVYEPHFMAFLIRASYSFFVVFFFVCAYAYKLLSVPS